MTDQIAKIRQAFDDACGSRRVDRYIAAVEDMLQYPPGEEPPALRRQFIIVQARLRPIEQCAVYVMHIKGLMCSDPDDIIGNALALSEQEDRHHSQVDYSRMAEELHTMLSMIPLPNPR